MDSVLDVWPLCSSDDTTLLKLHHGIIGRHVPSMKMPCLKLGIPPIAVQSMLRMPGSASPAIPRSNPRLIVPNALPDFQVLGAENAKLYMSELRVADGNKLNEQLVELEQRVVESAEAAKLASKHAVKARGDRKPALAIAAVASTKQAEKAAVRAEAALAATEKKVFMLEKGMMDAKKFAELKNNTQDASAEVLAAVNALNVASAAVKAANEILRAATAARVEAQAAANSAALAVSSATQRQKDFAAFSAGGAAEKAEQYASIFEKMLEQRQETLQAPVGAAASLKNVTFTSDYFDKEEREGRSKPVPEAKSRQRDMFEEWKGLEVGIFSDALTDLTYDDLYEEYGDINDAELSEEDEMAIKGIFFELADSDNKIAVDDIFKGLDLLDIRLESDAATALRENAIKNDIQSVEYETFRYLVFEILKERMKEGSEST
eukprot:gnl/MRDRNA2_/MRDRNA2_71588_c0_seq1.p1 gnl/MRDRNA2_/MRDRNA2_71588_c0~~gnl/MRDRNA2_/MRDRNA2_71588_c0_seq1.p1  ORF type:complete len:435 (+),score=99.58 gnl/MRDRNA2_/MRDRNA2_71588_c0_seq1:1-1305(+)